MGKSLQEMNKELKTYVNEASGISNKCRGKLIRLVEKIFLVKLPHDNFLNVDISLLENGNVMMRDVEYSTEEEVDSLSKLEERFLIFQEEVSVLLDKNHTNFKTMRQKNDFTNLLILIFMLLVAGIIIYYSIHALISGDFRGFLWALFIVGYYLIPATRDDFLNRLMQAKRYLSSLFKK